MTEYAVPRSQNLRAPAFIYDWQIDSREEGRCLAPVQSALCHGSAIMLPDDMPFDCSSSLASQICLTQ
jgi:hypothetical protein